ncbi:MAG: Gfo/Idh/MocA family oxidoreductase [Ruminococcaceae bacterium]|nr:Gfo/Idh/MocA family oxidoreductase [Oscillospiraceae bacterium]
MMKAAVIGFGTISGTHMKAIAANDGMELAAICDVKEELKVKVPEGVAFYTDYKRMCREIKPDVVHICLPHYLHYPVTKDVVEMGFNVFCEKPVALNVEEAEAFAALEEAHPEVKIGICLQNRMNDTTIELKKILDSGEYGEIRGVRGFVPWYRDSSYYEVSPWRGIMQYAGGGCMINQALHTLDLLYYFGGDISRIHAVVGQTNDLGIEVEGDIVARLEYANGARGLFFATTNNWANESVQIRVACEKAAFQIEDDRLYKLIPGGEREVLVASQRRDDAKFYYGSSHARLIARFYKAVETGSDDYIHVKDAVMVIRLIETIVKSSKEDKLLEV